MTAIELISELTCPECGHITSEIMPTDQCLYFYECRHCGTPLKPLPDDCCVFCSWGSVPCPAIQKARRQGNADDSAKE